ncbi:LOW QUALITY PROTEIN: hypothetical protein PHPALM_29032 [Phytophthora palmivora]|uniref:DDE Tnp4 domain-containing protein n=1 Tax=Phytophthora palmivora TaxID=4796 RepID=A0A2P4X8L8_9STRA|nr:LOW QUALITY PROTEIN: hypothetical protein PHPALM_29032 [Phytophthora palmivora]
MQAIKIPTSRLSGATSLLFFLDELDEADDAVLVERCVGWVERLLIPNVRFDFGIYPNANALQDFRFTCAEIRLLADVMNMPNVFITNAGDRLLGVEAVAMLCYQLSNPGKFSRLNKEWHNTLYFHDRLDVERHHIYVQAVSTKINGIVDKISMSIDGTKGFICRPGLWVSFCGSIEGRLHDSTMLRKSRILTYLASNDFLRDLGVHIYGDPVYGINDVLWSPFRNAYVLSDEKRFNVVMIKALVSIEWLFGVVKKKWSFLDWNKNIKFYQRLWLEWFALQYCLITH